MTWTYANKLTINTDKTHFVIFTLKRLDLALLPPLLINNVSLSPKLYTKFLGVTLDSRLNFKQHIQSIAPKVSKTIGILCRLKKKLPPPPKH